MASGMPRGCSGQHESQNVVNPHYAANVLFALAVRRLPRRHSDRSAPPRCVTTAFRLAYCPPSSLCTSELR